MSNFKVIPDQDLDHFQFYVTHIFGEELVRTWLPLWGSAVKTDPEALTDKIYDSLYGVSESVTNPSTSHTALLTALDSELPDEAPKGRKRRLLGRVRKQLGDLCLFAGSPVDAMNQYRAALEISRTCSDWEWVGSTLESMASAILSARDANGLKTLTSLEVLEVTSRLTEAKTFYSRKLNRAPALEADNLIRTAHFLLQEDKKLEMAEMLSKCHELLDSLDSTFTPLKIRLLSSIALIYRNADYSRKYAFYIQLVTRLCPSAGVPAARSHQLLEQIAPEYDITVNSLLEPMDVKVATAVTNALPLAPSAVKTRREKMIAAGPTWTTLQASILTLLSDLSFESGDTLQSMKYLVYLMREVSPKFLDASYASESSALSPLSTNWGYRLQQLSMTLPPPLDTFEGDPLRLGLGFVKTWKPLKDPSVYMHISRSVSDPLFLYRPNRKAKEAIAASANHSFAWPGASLNFEFGLTTTNMQRTVIEDVKIVYSPIVLTTTEPRPGDIRMEVDWNPPFELDSCIQPTAQVVIEAREVANVKISTIIPAIKARKVDRSIKSPLLSSSTHSTSTTPIHMSNEIASMDTTDDAAEEYLKRVLSDPSTKILLAPKSLLYTLYNFPFAEPLLKMGETAPKQLLLECLHYIHAVPTVSIEDVSHPWVSYTSTSRDAEPILAIGHGGAPKAKQAHGSIRKSASSSSAPIQDSSALNLSQSHLPPKAPEPHKSIQNLNVATSQLRGESFGTTLILKNESKFPVEDFGLTIQENGETLGSQLAPQIIVGGVARIYDAIAASLPLRSGEAIQIPLEFCAPMLGLVQVSFLMEYRNNRSAENMWRKMRMDYSFKVVESLTPTSLGVLRGLESSMDVLDRAMPHNVFLVPDANLDNPEATVLDSENYFLLQLGLQNKTMLSFQVVREDQLFSHEALQRAHPAFVVDPWATKLFCIALHRKSFVQRMFTAAEAIKDKDIKHSQLSLVARYREATKEWLKTELTKFSWKSYGNRSGVIQFDPTLVTDDVLDALIPQRYSASVHLETSSGEIIKIQAPPETPGTESFVLQANQIYKICGKVHFLGPLLPAEERHAENTSSEKSSKTGNLHPEISKNQEKSSSSAPAPSNADLTSVEGKSHGTLFSAVIRSRHLNNQARNVTLIGKSQNIDLPPLNQDAPPHSVRIPVLFHSAGIYSITTRVHDGEGSAGNTEDFWTRDLSVVVTR